MALEDSARGKGDRTMSLGFIAQYAAEAALQTDGVASLEHSSVAAFKDSFGVEHEGEGVEVRFKAEQEGLVDITVYPVIYFGRMIPEVAWQIQVNVKADVEKYTGLIVNSVNVYVRDIIPQEEGFDA
ncbi:MAG: Asp23/Gls24 family envelope stress response protein [Clostridiaceae bacterium]|nr:Asp23/Gls24 family envelope stress response protein [Clostridiaceae bacterium]